MQHKRVTFLAFVLFLAAAVVAWADPTDDFIKAEMKTQNIPGLSLVVIKDGEIIKAEGYGLANRALQIPATPETVYKIASVSKQFMAAGIMLLLQEGKLGLDDPIGKYLEGTPATWKAITIRHLLTHTSGMVREAPGFDPFKIQSDADVLKTAYPLPLRFAPGEKWEYGNTGYFALAEIIRKVSGRPWSEYLSEKVFKPSGMNMTHPTNTKVSVPNRALGYADNDKLLNAADWAALRPSGAFSPRFWIWRSGTPRSIPTRSSATPLAAKCGLRSNSTTAQLIPTASVGSLVRSEIVNWCITAAGCRFSRRVRTVRGRSIDDHLLGQS